MGKVAFTLLAILALSACSKEDSHIAPTDGQYVAYTEYVDEYNNLSNTFCVTIEEGQCTDFVLYTGAERFDYERSADIRTNGRYPNCTYRIDDFTVQAQFTDLENFTANLSGTLSNYKEIDFGAVGEAYTNIALEATDVHFRLDNTSLDANGDGLLDSKQ